MSYSKHSCNAHPCVHLTCDGGPECEYFHMYLFEDADYNIKAAEVSLLELCMRYEWRAEEDRHYCEKHKEATA